LIESFVLTY